MNFNDWLDTFVDEKGLDPNHLFDFVVDGQAHIFALAVVIEYIKNVDRATKRTIKKNIVYIDFKNGDVMHFFEYMAKGIAQQHGNW
jgi:hypothetical protein